MLRVEQHLEIGTLFLRSTTLPTSSRECRPPHPSRLLQPLVCADEPPTLCGHYLSIVTLSTRANACSQNIPGWKVRLSNENSISVFFKPSERRKHHGAPGPRNLSLNAYINGLNMVRIGKTMIIEKQPRYTNLCNSLFSVLSSSSKSIRRNDLLPPC